MRAKLRYTSVLVFAAVLTLSGCALGSRSFTIVDLSTGNRTHVGGRPCHREVVLGTDDRSAIFRTMYADHRHRLFTRTSTYGGKVIETRPVPSAFEGYGYLYHVEQGYALSPDGDSLAYLRESAGELRILGLRSAESRTIATNVTQSMAYVTTLRWLSDTELLLAVDAPGQPNSQITVFDTRQGAVTLRLDRPRLSLLFGVLTEGRYASFKKGVREILVYDLYDRREVGTISPSGGDHVGYEEWCTGSKPRLLYIESTKRSPLLRLMEFDPTSTRTQELRRWSSAGRVFMCGCVSNRLVYELEPPSPPTKAPPDAKLFLWDMGTGTETEIKGVRTRGRVCVIDGGRRIIYEYWP